MREVHKNGHAKYWLPLLEYKFEGKGKTFGRSEFDEFLGGYSVCFSSFICFLSLLRVRARVDRCQKGRNRHPPPAIFAQELMDAYPSAKIILIVRDEEKWFESMKATLWHAGWKNVGSPGVDERREFGRKMSRYLWGEDKEENGKRIFREENVKRWAGERGREVLVLEVKEGWGPLCEFLGKSVPEEEDFPRKDDWANYKKEHGTGTS
jgi:hypothetical protein